MVRNSKKVLSLSLIGSFAVLATEFSSIAQAVEVHVIEAVLQVDFLKQEILPSKSIKDYSEEFDVFRNTQAGLLNSQFVLQSALVRREIASLKVVLDHEPNAWHWLRNALQVELPKSSELIILRLSDRGDTKQLKKILDAVIAAYKQEVLGRRRIQDFEDHEILRKYCVEHLDKYKTDLEEYHASMQALPPKNPQSHGSGLEIAKLQLEVDRLFLADLAREIRVLDMNMELSASRVRIVQPAVVVSQ